MNKIKTYNEGAGSGVCEAAMRGPSGKLHGGKTHALAERGPPTRRYRPLGGSHNTHHHLEVSKEKIPEEKEKDGGRVRHRLGAKKKGRTTER